MRSIIFSLMLVAAPLSAAQAAQYVVSESRGAGISVGSVIDPTKALMLKQGQHLTLISESGQIVHIDGPYQKPPIQESGVTLSAALGGLVTERNARTSELGTSRSAAGRAPLPRPWVIDATSSGSACLLDGTVPVLWRPTDKASAALNIMPADRSWKAQTRWPAGAPFLALSDDLGVHGDASYFVSVDGAESAITIVSMPAALTTEEMRKAWMVEKGCGRQVEAMLRASR